jgi:lysophospholipase L1-like esterase
VVAGYLRGCAWPNGTGVDGIHPGDEGHDVLATAIGAEVKEVLL